MPTRLVTRAPSTWLLLIAPEVLPNQDPGITSKCEPVLFLNVICQKPKASMISPMATQSKSQFLADVHAQLKRRYKPKSDRAASRFSVLEAVVYGICHEDTTREQANQALSRFKDQFFDWNEVRVSPIGEVQETLADIPDPQGRAQRIRRFLRQLFARTYGFSLEPLTKKPLKEALKVLSGYEAFSSDYVTATVIQLALGGHAIPVDSSTRRALLRLGISEPDLPALRSVLERAVPKNRGVEFIELLEELVHDTCVETNPDCPRCELRKICPFAQARKSESRSTATASLARKPNNNPRRWPRLVRPPPQNPPPSSRSQNHRQSPASPVRKRKRPGRTRTCPPPLGRPRSLLLKSLQRFQDRAETSEKAASRRRGGTSHFPCQSPASRWPQVDEVSAACAHFDGVDGFPGWQECTPASRKAVEITKLRNVVRISFSFRSR